MSDWTELLDQLEDWVVRIERGLHDDTFIEAPVPPSPSPPPVAPTDGERARFTALTERLATTEAALRDALTRTSGDLQQLRQRRSAARHYAS